MVLIDTTVWIDFFKNKHTPQVSVLELLLSEGEDVCTCGIVLAEVLQGVRDVMRELCLEPLGLSVTYTAEALGVSRKTLSSPSATL